MAKYRSTAGGHQQILSRINAQDTSPLAYANQRCVATRLGTCQVDVATIQTAYTLGVAAATVTYSEVGIAVGKQVMLGNPTLTIIGWANISADALAGNNNFVKTLTMSRLPAVGESLWFVTATDAVTPLTWRTANGAETLGGLVYRDATRPSTNLNVPLTFTYNTGVVALIPKADLCLNP